MVRDDEERPRPSSVAISTLLTYTHLQRHKANTMLIQKGPRPCVRRRSYLLELSAILANTCVTVEAVLLAG